MKKVLKRGNVPPLLDSYLQTNPNNDWDQFTGNDRNGHAEVKGALRVDQRGLCAYCEIDLALGNGKDWMIFEWSIFIQRNRTIRHQTMP